VLTSDGDVDDSFSSVVSGGTMASGNTDKDGADETYQDNTIRDIDKEPLSYKADISFQCIACLLNQLATYL